MGQRTGIMAAVAAAGLAGCLDEEVAKSGFRSKPVDVPAASEASVAVAARVDQVGRQLVSQNPFLGVEPTFHTIGRREPELHHPDLSGVFITEGLAGRCQTDAELAAVLATELAKMAAEKRTADRMRLPDPLQTLPDAGGTAPGSDPTQLAVQAVFDQKLTRGDKKEKKPTTDDPRALAEEILRSAGYEAKSLDTVAPLLEEARRHSAVAEHLGGRRSKPRWSP
jgi:hypothetical protein